MDNRKLMYEMIEGAVKESLQMPKSEVEKLAVIIFEKIENNFSYQHYDNLRKKNGN
jgi:hypothetical protein